MTNLSPEICRKLKEARKSAGLSQSILAREVGCKQSALSMFEQGDGTKLNDDAIEKLCKKFGIELKFGTAVEEVAPVPRPVTLAVAASGYCPNVACPSHTRYEVDGKVFLKPNRAETDPIGGKYCAICGELLERTCPNCGAPVHAGAVCSLCGESYLAI